MWMLSASSRSRWVSPACAVAARASTSRSTFAASEAGSDKSIENSKERSGGERVGPARPEMEPAFLLALLLPPPAAGALRLAGLERPRAGRAADRGEAAGMERVQRHVMLGREGQRLLAA